MNTRFNDHFIKKLSKHDVDSHQLIKKQERMDSG